MNKRKFTRKSGEQYFEYKFDREICRNCPHRSDCIKGKAIGNKLIIGVNTPIFYKYSQRQKAPVNGKIKYSDFGR